MFKILGSLTKAVVGVAVAPVAVVVDVVTSPGSAYEGKGAFDRTAKVMDSIGKNVKDAIEPE